MWQKLAFFVGGLAIGGAAGYFTAKYLIEDKALKETERQVSEIKDYYEARLKSTEKAAELNELKRKYAENKIAERGDAPMDYTKHFTGGKPVDIQPNPVAQPEDYSEDDCYAEVPLGEGQVPWDNYIAALREIGFDGFLTIEREVGDNPVADIRKAAEFLKAYIAK